LGCQARRVFVEKQHQAARYRGDWHKGQAKDGNRGYKGNHLRKRPLEKVGIAAEIERGGEYNTPRAPIKQDYPP
jgi:hypothetical protein